MTDDHVKKIVLVVERRKQIVKAMMNIINIIRKDVE